MEDNVIYLENLDNFKGVRGSLATKDDMIEERVEKKGMAEIEASAVQTLSDFDNVNEQKGVSEMEITPKEYIDDRIKTLEKSMGDKFDAQEKLLSEKIDHLATKFDASLETKFNSFKSEILKEDKESRRFLITTILTSVGIATAIIIGVLGFVIK